MKSLRVTASRKFVRWNPPPEPTCPRCNSGMKSVQQPVPRFVVQQNGIHGHIHALRQMWRCKREECHFWIVGEFIEKKSYTERRKDAAYKRRHYAGCA